MKRKSPSLNPQKINEFIWYYEYRGGIDLIMEIRDNNGNYIRTDRARISKRQLIKSLGRMQ